MTSEKINVQQSLERGGNWHVWFSFAYVGFDGTDLPSLFCASTYVEMEGRKICGFGPADGKVEV